MIYSVLLPFKVFFRNFMLKLRDIDYGCVLLVALMNKLE